MSIVGKSILLGVDDFFVTAGLKMVGAGCSRSESWRSRHS